MKNLAKVVKAKYQEIKRGTAAAASSRPNTFILS